MKNGIQIPEQLWLSSWKGIGLLELYTFDGKTYRDDSDCHRVDGPSIIFSNQKPVWIVDGIRCRTQEEYKHHARIFDEDISILILKYGDIT